uniref:Uncharacterized protein n=1 Tax=Picea sitchensis TaxID=3332 RepID=D5ABP6_PICSI|nr:unknown [Picea sitchensis]
MITMQKSHLWKTLRNLRKRSMGYKEIALSPSSSAKKRNRRRNAVTVVVGKEKKIFTVEPQILDSGLFQPLVEKATVGRIAWEANSRKSPCVDCVFLDCDAILFEHMLWLVHNDDPSLRYLNLDMLMEFYAQ